MAIVNGNNPGGDIAKIFGIKHCKMLNLHFAVDEIATVTVQFYPEEDQIRQLIPILKKYRLEEIDKKEENNMLIFGEKGNEV